MTPRVGPYGGGPSLRVMLGWGAAIEERTDIVLPLWSEGSMRIGPLKVLPPSSTSDVGLPDPIGSICVLAMPGALAWSADCAGWQQSCVGMVNVRVLRL